MPILNRERPEKQKDLNINEIKLIKEMDKDQLEKQTEIANAIMTDIFEDDLKKE